MCKFKTTITDPVDVETTNIGFLNISETSGTLVGLGEILFGINLVKLLWLIVETSETC